MCLAKIWHRNSEFTKSFYTVLEKVCYNDIDNTSQRSGYEQYPVFFDTEGNVCLCL